METLANGLISAYSGSTPAVIPSQDGVIDLGVSSFRYNYIYSSHALNTSDGRLKENLRKLNTPLENILKIEGVMFDWKKESFGTDDEKLKTILIEKGKNKLGFIAQDLQKVFPSLVYYENDNYSIDYIGMIPVLTEAIKEQQVLI